jgi:hypothetical protein
MKFFKTIFTISLIFTFTLPSLTLTNNKDTEEKTDEQILIEAFLEESKEEASQAIYCLRDMFIGYMTSMTGIPGEGPIGALEAYLTSVQCDQLEKNISDAAEPYAEPIKSLLDSFADYALEEVKGELGITTKEQMKSRLNRISEDERRRLIKRFADHQFQEFIKANSETIDSITSDLKKSKNNDEKQEKPFSPPTNFSILTN